MKRLIIGMCFIGITAMATENPFRVGETIYYADGKMPVIVSKILSPQSIEVSTLDGKEKMEQMNNQFMKPVPCVYASSGYHTSKEALLAKVQRFCKGDIVYYFINASSFRLNPKQHPIKLNEVFSDGRANVTYPNGTDSFGNYLSTFRVVQ